MKTIHIAEMIADGGREGIVEAPDGHFRVQLSTAEQRDSVTPEHLFAGAYAACFLAALKSAAEAAHLELTGITVTARAYLEEDERGGHLLDVDLRATVPGIAESAARHLLNLAHHNCPYSKATRGNIRVSLGFD
jgi:lipoyl-dependent peroxiredoxin